MLIKIDARDGGGRKLALYAAEYLMNNPRRDHVSLSFGSGPQSRDFVATRVDEGTIEVREARYLAAEEAKK